jgi:uncharacterized membrane protein (DUF106 family)
VFIEDAMLIDFEEWYMLRNNLKSYGQQIQSMFKTNKINKAKQNQNQKQHKQTQMKKNTCELKSLTTKKTRHMSMYIRVLVKNWYAHFAG